MIAEQTLQLRHKLAYGTMQLLAPKLKAELQQNRKDILNDTPRPFTRMLKHLPRELVGAEIGYGLGVNAENLLSELNIKKLYCIDAYFADQPYTDTGHTVDWYYNSKNTTFYNRRQKLWKTNKVQFIKEHSCNAFSYLPMDLDFVYIDGCHEYSIVFDDITNALLHTKTSGYVGGHDFANDDFPGVAQAVYDYSRIHGTIPEMVYPDFWFKKEVSK